MDENEMTRAEEVAKRAFELAARAEELARHAHEVAGVDEQLAALESELDSLVAEEAALDAGIRTDQSESGGGAEGGDWTNWTETFGERMEALGDRLGDLISGTVDAALQSSRIGAPPFTRGRRAGYKDGESTLALAGPTPVKVLSQGGGVEVRPGEANRVQISWRSRGWATRPIEYEPVTVAERDGVVLIESSGGRSWRPNVVHIEVEVPVGSPVDVTTGGGSVRIEGTRAPVTARTGGGSMSIVDVEGEVSATTGGGSVRVEGRLKGQSAIRTGGGSVKVVLSPGTRIDLDAKGTSAVIDVPGLKVQGFHVSGSVDGGGDGRLEVRTGGGSALISQG